MNSCFVYPIFKPECSFGVCANGTCICDSELFSGASDWVNTQDRDCHIILPLIYTLWCLNIVEIIYVALRAIPPLRRQFDNHAKIRATLKKRGKPYRVQDNLGFLSTLPFWAVSLPCHTALAIFKLVQRDARLGTDLGLTLLWMFSRIFGDLAFTTGRAALTFSIMQSEGAASWVIGRRQLYLLSLFAISLLATQLIWPTYVLDSLHVSMATFAVHFIVVGLVYLANAHVSRHLAISIDDSMTASYAMLQDERVLMVRDVLASEQRRESLCLLLLGSSFLVLGVVPSLWTCHDYFFAILWLLFPYMGLHNLLSLDLAQQRARGDPSRFFEQRSEGDMVEVTRTRKSSVTTPAKNLKQLASNEWW